MNQSILLFAFLLLINSLLFAQFDRWVDAGDMLGARYDHTSTLLTNGKVLIVGNYLDKNELYDPISDMFTATGSSHFYRLYGSTATLLNDGKVLIVGGDNAQNKAELYDPATESFELIDSLNTVHCFHTATLLNDGRVLIAGGQDQRGGPQTHAVCEIYDPQTSKFTLVDSLNEDRSGHSAVLLLDGRVLIIGGFKTTTPGVGSNVNTCELYDPQTGLFTFTKNLNEPRAFLDATLLINGKVLASGGAWNQRYCEIYDPVTETYSLTGDMTVVRRSSHTATILHNGKVLLVGGYADSVTPTAEIYDPSTNSFTAVDSMKVPREQHRATRLNDGSVLVTGGYSTGFAVNSTERYLVDTNDVVSIREVNNFPGSIPDDFQLFQNYPNPFNPTTRIEYQLPFDSKVTIELYSISGEKVATIIRKELAAGYYSTEINASVFNLSSGVYFYKISAISQASDAEAFVKVKKLMLMK